MLKDDDRYPRIPLFNGEKGYYATLAEAEEAMRSEVARRRGHKYSSIYAFLVRELPFGVPYDWGTLSERLYSGEGELIDRSMCADGGDRVRKVFDDLALEYNGRQPSEIRFKEGDIVEVLAIGGKRSEAELMVVGRPPFTPEGIAALDKQLEEYGQTAQPEDEYACLPLGADSFEYVPPTRILAPRRPLDDDTIMEYREYYAAARSRRIIPRRRW